MYLPGQCFFFLIEFDFIGFLIEISQDVYKSRTPSQTVKKKNSGIEWRYGDAHF